jgi:hypothetical protein
MKINILLTFIFLSIVVYASVNFSTGIVGTTLLNGEGCVCHALNPSSSVNVWIEGPDTVSQGETVQYLLYLLGGPAMFGGFNVAARFGDLSPANSEVIEIDEELTHAFPHPFPIAQPVIWQFNYTAVVQGWDTLYSVGNSVDGNGIPSNDEWNFGANFPVFVGPPVPVELVSFSAAVQESQVLLSWITATELNNLGFEIEKQEASIEYGELSNNQWIKIGFVEGKGTTTETNYYSFNDADLSPGKYHYRLKQIDFDGTFAYSDIVTVEVQPNSFLLSQNYPNPFNPKTIISFNLPDEGFLSLKIYNIQGELVETLSEEYRQAGLNNIEWNASGFTSGVYFYSMNFESPSGQKFSEVKKMVLAK